MSFVHLHCHSHYSLLDGLGKIPELIARAKELGMEALALTDHAVMYGAIEFYEEAKKAGIKPIVGLEVYIAPRATGDARPFSLDECYHLTLLAADFEGYKNLMALATLARTEGMGGHPCVHGEMLRSHSRGIIALSGCLKGEAARAAVAGDLERAQAALKKYVEIFGKDNFYVELQAHNDLPLQVTANKALTSAARILGLPLVATKDIHYILPDDGEAQDVLTCIGAGKVVDDPTRFSMRDANYSMATPEEMAAVFAALPEAVENTVKIAERCNLTVELGKWVFPKFEVPEGKTAEAYLREQTFNELSSKVGALTPEITERLNYELQIIEKKGYATYFLVVADYVNWARSRGIISTTRGSAAGSLVSYAIGITTVNPLDYKLPFERFLNPYRPSPPDIDMDFADNRRDEVIAYVTKKYGAGHVAQICTFGAMMARGAVRDVGRALGFPYSFCDRVAKLIPFGSQGFPMTIAKAKELSEELRNLYGSNADVKKLLDLAERLEGSARHASVHAAGVVISPTPLTDYTPLQREAGGEKIITQYDMHAVEAAGLLKMDFLGIRNLSILGSAVELAAKTKNAHIDLQTLPLDDVKTFELLARGNTVGLFQLGGSGMTRYLKELRPTTIFDIMAMVALYRPGPLESIPEFIRRKHNPRLIKLLDPRMKDILSMSYGIITYQDDVLLTAIGLAGYTWEEADKLRKAMGKKIPKEMAAQKDKFISGCVKNSVEKGIAEEIWKLIEPFAAYGFNKCLTGETVLTDAKTGRRWTISELYRTNKHVALWAIDENFKLRAKKIRAIQSNGTKQVFEILTRTGKSIRATATHPFLTVTGWKELSDLKVGARIAIPRALPEILRPRHLKRHELITLGYLLAEGNFCHPHGVYFYSKSKKECEDFVRATSFFSNSKIHFDRSKSTTAIYIGKQQQRLPNELMEWIRALGLAGKKATEKFFPEIVFSLPVEDLSLLLGKLWQGDGCCFPKNDGQIFYATSSPRLAKELTHLLLRLGIVSVCHQKKFAYRGSFKNGWTIHVSSFPNVERFGETVGAHLIGEKRQTLAAIVKEKREKIPMGKPLARGTLDTIPVDVFPVIRRAMAEKHWSAHKTAAMAGVDFRLLYRDWKKKGYTRNVVRLLGEALRSKELKRLGDSDVLWDEVKEIRFCGKEETFDIIMPSPHHNFVANDMIVHNSHAVSYAIVAYQTAYMKARFPAEYMTAVMTAESGDLETIAEVVAECRALGIEVLPPDVNASGNNFTVIDDRHIRFGLLAIKNLGADVIATILAERERGGVFKSITDFAERMPTKYLNKKSMEALIKSGAMNSLGEAGMLLSNLETLLEYHRMEQRSRESGQVSLFGGGSRASVSEFRLAPSVPVAPQEKLKWEKELLGLYISAHPFAFFENKLSGKLLPLGKLRERPKGSVVLVGGMVSGIKKILTKAGETMFFVKLEDSTGVGEVIVFPKALKETSAMWQEDAPVVVAGSMSEKDDEPRVLCSRATVLTKEAVDKLVG